VIEHGEEFKFTSEKRAHELHDSECMMQAVEVANSVKSVGGESVDRGSVHIADVVRRTERVKRATHGVMKGVVLCRASGLCRGPQSHGSPHLSTPTVAGLSGLLAEDEQDRADWYRSSTHGRHDAVRRAGHHQEG
jgi:hypothetical protein